MNQTEKLNPVPFLMLFQEINPNPIILEGAYDPKQQMWIPTNNEDSMASTPTSTTNTTHNHTNNTTSQTTHTFGNTGQTDTDHDWDNETDFDTDTTTDMD